MKQLLSFLTKNIFIILCLLFSLFAVASLFHSGLIPTHDGEYHLIRFYEFNKILSAGNWYPRWASDLNFGYGIPLFTYIYPLPNYIASLFHLFGASFLDSVKLNMITATLVGGVLMYLWSRRFWGNWGGLLSSILYTYAPYHFVDIFVRGSVGEVWALALFPGFLWTYTTFAATRKLTYGISASIFLALTILSHNILGLMFFLFAISYMTILIVNNQAKKFLILTSLFLILLCLGLSAIFWLPALFETKYVTGLQIYNIEKNFPDLFQLLFPSWGTGFFDGDLTNQMSVQIGLLNLFVVVISFVLLFLRKLQKQRELVIFLLLWFFLLLFLMLPGSLFFWQHAPLLHYFQFPWRLLSLVILVCSFLGGSIVSFRYGKFFAILAAFFAIITTYTYTQPAYYMLRDDHYYISRSNFIDSTNSPGNLFDTLWNQKKTERASNFLLSTGNTAQSMSQLTPTFFTGKLSASNNTQEVIAISYFPGWEVFIDGNSVKVAPQDGLLSFTLPKGMHTVTILLDETPIQKLARFTSIVSIIVLILLFILRKRVSPCII